MSYEKKKIPGQLFIFLSFLTIFYFAYWPIFAFDFAFHDEVVLFAKGLPIPCYIHDFFSGRFIGAIVGMSLQNVLNRIVDLHILRFLNLVLLSLMGTMTIGWLKQKSVNPAQGFCAVLIVFTQPPFQVWMASSGIIFHFASVFYSFLATVILTRSKDLNDRHTFQSAFLLMIALMFYPPGAMFFWAVNAGIFLFNCYQGDRSEQKKHLFNTFAVGMTVIMIYAVILKCVKPSFHYDESWKLYDPTQMTWNYFQKFSWFKDEVVFSSLNLWNIFPIQNVSFLVATVILSAFCLRISKRCHHEPDQRSVIRDLLLGVVLLPGFLILSFLPNLAAQGNAPWYRCCVGVTTVIVFLLIWAVYEWHLFIPKRWRGLFLTMILICGSGYGAYQAARTILLYRVLPCAMEFNDVKKQLSLFPMEKSRRIHFILNKNPMLHSRYDELGLFNLDIPGTAYLVTTLAIKEIAWERWIKIINLTGHMEGDLFVVDFMLQPKHVSHPVSYRLLISDNLTFPQEQLQLGLSVIDLTGVHQEIADMIKDLEKKF